MKKVILSLSIIVAFCTVVSAAPKSGALDIYIASTTKDGGRGTMKKPVGTVQEAHILAAKYFGNRAINFIFMDGTHYLDETIVILPEHSGSEEYPVTYKAQNSGKATISGGKKLSLEWEKYRDGIYMAKVEAGMTSIDQLYVNGKRAVMARYPNVVENKNVFDTWGLVRHNATSDIVDLFDPSITSRWSNPEGGYIHAMLNVLWGGMHWEITGKDENGELCYEGGWQNNRPSQMHKVYRIAENIFEELDAPNEWFYDEAKNMLYLYPQCEVEQLKEATIEAVMLETLIEFKGDRENTIAYNNIEGLVFTHSTRTFMKCKEPLLRSDWRIYRGGALFYEGVINSQVVDCEFDQVGGNTIFVNNYNRDLLFTGCYIHNSGANGICFVGDSEAVRSPLFEYSERDYDTMDMTPGPNGDNYPDRCTVDDCLITLTGRYEKQTAPVQISMSHAISVIDCSIYDVPRAGINISEGTFGGHIIDGCDVFNTVLETGDHGSFNSWGRDRYWSSDYNKANDMLEVGSLMPMLDMLDINIIRNSRFRCDHGWDIDLDDGSSRYHIYNNVLLGGGLKLREGLYRVATNNIIINNTFHPHVWYTNSDDVFKNNILYGSYSPARMQRHINAKNGKWGKEVDFNLFYGPSDPHLKFAANGCDHNSISADPLFVNPAIGDYRLKEGSPALKIGFKSFDTTRYGVRKSDLRAIAKSPKIPLLE